MENLHQQLHELVKFFTTDTLTGLPHKIGKFTCIPLMSTDREHAGYLVTKGAEMHFFPAASMNKITGSEENFTTDMEHFIEEQWGKKSSLCLN